MIGVEAPAAHGVGAGKHAASDDRRALPACCTANRTFLAAESDGQITRRRIRSRQGLALSPGVGARARKWLKGFGPASINVSDHRPRMRSTPLPALPRLEGIIPPPALSISAQCPFRRAVNARQHPAAQGDHPDGRSTSPVRWRQRIIFNHGRRGPGRQAVSPQSRSRFRASSRASARSASVRVREWGAIPERRDARPADSSRACPASLPTPDRDPACVLRSDGATDGPAILARGPCARPRAGGPDPMERPWRSPRRCAPRAPRHAPLCLIFLLTTPIFAYGPERFGCAAER